MNIQHSSHCDFWLTPLYILNRVHCVFEKVHLDPASDMHANRRVGALNYLTVEQDALTTEWDCVDQNIWINPPGGKVGNKSKAGLFWDRLVYYHPTFNHAIFLAFNLEALQHTQQSRISMAQCTFCVPSKRIRFDLPSGLGQKSAPSHASAIIYLPGKIDATKVFIETFNDFGAICNKRK